MTSDDGMEVDFGRRREPRPVKVVPQKTAILALVGGLVTGGGGTAATANFILRAAMQQEIKQHDRDPEAHAPLVRAAERWRDSQASDDAEKQRLQVQLDAMQRDLRETREAVIRLEARFGKAGQR